MFEQPLKFYRFSTFQRGNGSVISEEKSGTQPRMEIRNKSKGKTAHAIPETTLIEAAIHIGVSRHQSAPHIIKPSVGGT